jgi:hypothetical protein
MEQACKGLHRVAHSRQVWVYQLKNLRQEDPVLKPAIPPLASLSTEDIKTFVIGRMKLRHRFSNDNENLGFAAKGATEIPGVCDLMLLPGGRSLLAIKYDEGDVTLHRIGLEDGQASLPVTANIGLGARPERMYLWNKLLITISPCPVLVHFRGDGLGIPLSVSYLPDRNIPGYHPPSGLSRSTTIEAR